jgi:hypothetical protein
VKRVAEIVTRCGWWSEDGHRSSGAREAGDGRCGEDGGTVELVRGMTVMAWGCQRTPKLGGAQGGGGAETRPTRGRRVWSPGTAGNS